MIVERTPGKASNKKRKHCFKVKMVVDVWVFFQILTNATMTPLDISKNPGSNLIPASKTPLNSWYSQYVRRQRLSQKSDIFPMHHGKKSIWRIRAKYNLHGNKCYRLYLAYMQYWFICKCVH